jgi:hypothetical protein
LVGRESDIEASPPLIAKHEFKEHFNIKGGTKGGLRILISQKIQKNRKYKIRKQEVFQNTN